MLEADADIAIGAGTNLRFAGCRNAILLVELNLEREDIAGYLSVYVRADLLEALETYGFGCSCFVSHVYVPPVGRIPRSDLGVAVPWRRLPQPQRSRTARKPEFAGFAGLGEQPFGLLSSPRGGACISGYGGMCIVCMCGTAA